MKLSECLGLSPILDVEERIAARASIGEKEYRGVVGSDAEQRVKYFFNRITDTHEVWTLWDGDELPTYRTTGNDAISCWPHKKFSKQNHQPSITDPRPVPIPIDDFIDEILFENEETAFDVAILPINGRSTKYFTRDGFLSALLENWYARVGNQPKFDAKRPSESTAEIIEAGFKHSMKTKPKGLLP